MTDARTVIANIKQRVYALHGGTVEAKLGSALAADILAALAEAGFVVVPREATVRMRQAGESAPNTRLASHVWRAMVEAANEQ